MDKKEAYQKLALMCSRKEYCISDIEKKMQSWFLLSNEQEQIIKELQLEKFIDETRFAEAFVKDKFKFNKWGKVKIIYYLKQKGISSVTISRALEQIHDTDYTNTINNLLISKNKNLKSKNNLEKKAKLLRFMTQRGFEFELINKQIDQLGG